MVDRATPRADPTTPNFGLTLPTVGLDRDTWGGITNGNWTAVDSALKAISDNANSANSGFNWLVGQIRSLIEPIGTVKMWPSTAMPAGWWSCDGNAVSRSAYPDLFAVIGTTWGAGDGSTTFNLPDLRGWTPVHRGGAWNGDVANKLGEVTHTLSWNEMPLHTHGGYTDWQGDHAHNYTGPASANLQGGFSPVPLAADGGQVTSTNGTHYHTLQVGNAGNSAAHNNIQPSVMLNFIIKLVVVF